MASGVANGDNAVVLGKVFPEVLEPITECDKGRVWAWNSGSIQLIINFGLEGLVDPLNLYWKADLKALLYPEKAQYVPVLVA